MYDEISLTEHESFRPRYDGLDKDFSRLQEHISNLFHDDRLFKEAQKSFDLIEPAAVQIEDAYFAQELYAAIEAYYSVVSLEAGGAEIPNAITRLIAVGQGQRVIRICRNSLAEKKAAYWALIDERARGFKMARYWSAPEKVQRNHYNRQIAQIGPAKAAMFARMDVAHEIFREAGATPAQLERLAMERVEIDQEQLRRPSGKPDPRKIDEDVFWEVIGTPNEGNAVQHIDDVTERLAMFKATPIKAFDKLLKEMDARAFRSDIWALAILLNGGCSDDDFEDFRCWLILQGRHVFEATLADPDSFDVSLFDGDLSECQALREASPLAYQMRTGKAMPRKPYVQPALGGEDVDEENLADVLPRVAAGVAALH